MSHDDPAMARFSPAGASSLGERATPASPPSSASSASPHGGDERRGGSIDSPPAGTGWSRRRRWLTTLITPIAVVVMAVGGHRAWTWQAERKLGAMVDELRRKGEPVSLAEINPRIPRKDNAAFDLRAAAEGLPSEGDDWQQFYSLGLVSLPLTADELDKMRPVVSKNADAIAMVRTAMSKPGIDWNATMAQPTTTPTVAPTGWGGRGSGFYRTRGLAQLLYAATLLSEHDGDQTAAIAHIEEMLFVAQAAATRPTVRSQMLAVRYYDLALLAVTEVLPDIADPPDTNADGTSGGNATPKPLKPAPAARVSALVAKLLDERDAREAILRCVRSERARCIEALLSPSSGASGTPSAFAGATESMPWNEPLPVPWPGGAWERILSRPVYLNRAQQGIERLNQAVAAFNAADLNEFLQAFPENPPPRVDARGDPIDEDGDNGYTRMLTTSVQAAAHVYYAGLAHRRTAAVALAIAQYRGEHGEWPPADMAPMFPHYLAKMPVDPLASSGERLVYLPDAERPRVYSVGEDGIDDGGVAPPNNQARPEDYRSTDWVVDLQRQPHRELPAAWPGRR